MRDQPKTVKVTRTRVDKETGARVTETVVSQIGQAADTASPDRGAPAPVAKVKLVPGAPVPPELATEVWKRRLEGESYRAIAQALGITKDQAHKIQMAELEALATARRDELRSYSREQELARLDAQQTAVDKIINWRSAGAATLPPTHREVTAAINAALKIQEQRARLLDLYDPEVVELRHSGTVNVQMQISKLAPLLAQLPEDQWTALGQIHETLAQLQAPAPEAPVPGVQ